MQQLITPLIPLNKMFTPQLTRSSMSSPIPDEFSTQVSMQQPEPLN